MKRKLWIASMCFNQLILDIVYQKLNINNFKGYYCLTKFLKSLKCNFIIMEINMNIIINFKPRE